MSSTYTQSSSQDSSYNTHEHTHVHTLNVFNTEKINVIVDEVEHYEQHVNYQQGGLKTVCSGNSINRDISSWGSAGGFGSYGGPSFQAAEATPAAAVDAATSAIPANPAAATDASKQ